ncbi:Hypothetical predicted protein [Octopus vulgaris]|uniref:tRNA-queuosine alpha-mannosyltransferase n=1 Tax=Octopus vulgaris TaxID=6645 RepID=A0AA36F6Z9_OCTVU|nr:Hypothetical predicted protein [Octopus vulgaris]
MTIILLEAFYGGSHKQLIDYLATNIPKCCVFKLPAKKWHWKARTSALHFSEVIPENENIYSSLFTSSVLNLAELVALRPDLARLHKVIYFHENQLIYPVRKEQTRDFQYGYNQILSCVVADVVVFNSEFNKNTFLQNINRFLNIIPDYHPKNLMKKIAPKCRVLYFPLSFPDCPTESLLENKYSHLTHGCMMDKCLEKILKETEECGSSSKLTEQISETSNEVLTNGRQDKILVNGTHSAVDCQNTVDYTSDKTFEPEILPSLQENGKILHIVWPHRWEHDKDPERFFNVLNWLHEENFDFWVSVIGQSFSEVPDVFIQSKEKLKVHLKTWGYVDDKKDYYEILKTADVVVSTAKHEFFGVSMLEAVYYGCYPLCPNKLVYPEIFPQCYLYNTEHQLFKKLKRFCKFPHLTKKLPEKIDLQRFMWKQLKESYEEVLKGTVSPDQTKTN